LFKNRFLGVANYFRILLGYKLIFIARDIKSIIILRGENFLNTFIMLMLYKFMSYLQVMTDIDFILFLNSSFTLLACLASSQCLKP